MKEELQDVNAKFSRISDEEISQVLEIAHRHKWEHRAHPIFEVEKEPIRRFTDAVGDASLLYWDAEYAKKSRYGSIIAPPGFISAPWFWVRSVKRGREEPALEAPGLADVIFTLAQAGYWRAIDSGIDYEFFQPIRVGDTIRSTSVIKDIIERGASNEKMVFLITETTYTNQNGKVVAKERWISIHR